MVRATGQYYQITHSNLHVCEFGTNCDPYTEGRQSLDPTENQFKNFTTNKAEFTSNEVILSKPGIYSMFAHIILLVCDLFFAQVCQFVVIIRCS